MKTIIASLLTLGSVLAVHLVGVTTASAAESPARCILYAREYAIAAVAPAPPGSTPAKSRQSIQDAAYARCMNLGVSALVPPGTATENDPSIEAETPKTVVKAPPRRVAKAPRQRRVAPVASVSAFVEGDRPASGGPFQAIAEVFGGPQEPRGSLVISATPSSCGETRGRTRFWRGLMSPSAGGC
jgi:hypothetical protein